jgi:hypothetical protein
MHTVFWLENLKGRDHLEYLGVGGRIILEWILGVVRRCGLDEYSLGEGPMAGCCEHGNEPSDSIKGGEFID